MLLNPFPTGRGPAAAALAGVLLLACAAQPATHEQLRATEQRFLAPFLQDVEVGCNELLVEMTPNFHPNVGQPAVDPRVHTRRREAGPGYIDQIWTNTLGQVGSAFLVTIGGVSEITPEGMEFGPMTRFRVLNRVRVRIYQEAHDVTLKVHARGVDGSPISLREPGMTSAVRVREYAFEDGERKAP